MTIKPINFFNPNSNKKIACIDDLRKTEDIDMDGKPDLAHGELVSLFLKSGLIKNGKNSEYGIDIFAHSASDGVNQKNKTSDYLAYILQNSDKYKAVNISQGVNVKYSFLNKCFKDEIGEEITPENIKRLLPQLRKAIEKSTDEGWKKYRDEFKKIGEIVDKLAEKNIPVYTSGSNYKNAVGVDFLFSDKVIQVGGNSAYFRTSKGNIPSLYAFRKDVGKNGENSLDTKNQPRYYLTNTMFGQIDFNGDNIFDYSISNLSSRGKSGKILPYTQGASLSSPTQLIKDLFEKQ